MKDRLRIIERLHPTFRFALQRRRFGMWWTINRATGREPLADYVRDMIRVDPDWFGTRITLGLLDRLGCRNVRCVRPTWMQSA